MIDWSLILAGAVWLGGAALALATLSYASWIASIRGQRLRLVLRQPAYLLLLVAAAVLICLGLGLTAATVWETILWLILAVISLITFVSLWHQVRHQKSL